MKPAGFSGPKGLLELGYRSELLGGWALKQVTLIEREWLLRKRA